MTEFDDDRSPDEIHLLKEEKGRKKEKDSVKIMLGKCGKEGNQSGNKYHMEVY